MAEVAAATATNFGTGGHMTRIPDPTPAEYCTVCKRPATASWSGDKKIAICPDCAIDVLPALMADAVNLNAYDAPKGFVRKIESNFWRALAIRLMRERDLPI
jgi:hypothetical protein